MPFKLIFLVPGLASFTTITILCLNIFLASTFHKIIFVVLVLTILVSGATLYLQYRSMFQLRALAQHQAEDHHPAIPSAPSSPYRLQILLNVTSLVAIPPRILEMHRYLITPPLNRTTRPFPPETEDPAIHPTELTPSAQVDSPSVSTEAASKPPEPC